MEKTTAAPILGTLPTTLIPGAAVVAQRQLERRKLSKSNFKQMSPLKQLTYQSIQTLIVPGVLTEVAFGFGLSDGHFQGEFFSSQKIWSRPGQAGRIGTSNPLMADLDLEAQF